MANILRIAVIIMVTSGLTAIIYGDRKRAPEANNNNRIILKLSRIIYWIGIATVVIFGVLLILSVVSTQTEVSNDDIFNIAALIFFFLGSALMASAGAFWKLEFSKKEDYFDYSTCFNRKYKIYYGDVKSVSVSGSTVSIRVKGHRFLISSSAINYESFAGFIKKKVPPASPNGGLAKKGAFKRAFKQLNDPLDILLGLVIGSVTGILGGFFSLYTLIKGNYVKGQGAIGIAVTVFFFVIGIVFPIVLVYSINHRDKHPLLFRLMLKQGTLKEDYVKKRKRKKKSKKK